MLVAPAALVIIAPFVRAMPGGPPSLAAAIGCALTAIAWMGFAAWRLAINIHRQNGQADDLY